MAIQQIEVIYHSNYNDWAVLIDDEYQEDADDVTNNLINATANDCSEDGYAYPDLTEAHAQAVRKIIKKKYGKNVVLEITFDDWST